MLKELYALKKEFEQRNIFFCFSGPISQNLVAEIGNILEHKMNLEKTSRQTIIRVFSMVVEEAQNIIHYSDEKLTTSNTNYSFDELSLGIIAIGHEKNHYFVSCGNIIENKKIEKLRQKLILIQGMNKDELKAYYRKKRRKEPEEGSKGAGLGFIDMAKKASAPIEFDFRKIDEIFSFFSLKTII